MNEQLYYKIGSLVLGLCTIIIVILIIQDRTEKTPDYTLTSEIKFEEELRMNRKIFLGISRSSDPNISSQLKSDCRHAAIEIDDFLYDVDYQDPKHEYLIRIRIAEILNEIKADPYIYAAYTSMKERESRY